MKKFISSLMVFITLFSSLPNVLAGKNGTPFQNINDTKYVEFLEDCDKVVTEMSKLPSISLAELMSIADYNDKMYEAKGYKYPEILCCYSDLVVKRERGICMCRHFAAYAFLKLHSINKRCFYVFLYDANRVRARDHAVAIYSVIENGKEVWKVCDISFAIMDKNKGIHDYKKWLSMDLIDYLNADDVIRSFGVAIAFDDPVPGKCFSKQNANDLKLYLAKYTPDYAKSFIENKGTELHIRNINAVNTAFGTSGNRTLQINQYIFLHKFIMNLAKPNEAPNV